MWETDFGREPQIKVSGISVRAFPAVANGHIWPSIVPEQNDLSTG
jgi:hypothetical protein